ncbi:zinc finger protein 488 [Pseudophryne corroboree]|uniref:zinc finger protein 488 n=1 Tax=Pseudophryne corroboree TaxID=495146 RepID=UPI0030820AAE
MSRDPEAVAKITENTYKKDGSPMKQPRHGTNFHSLARDVEQERTEQSDEEKTVLHEKTNLLGETSRREELLMGMTSECKGEMWRKVKAEFLEQKRSAFTEVYRTKHIGDRRIDFSGSAFSPVPGRLGNKINTVFKSGKSFRVTAPTNFVMPCEFLTLHSSVTVLPLPEVRPKSESPHSPQVLPPTLTSLGSTAQIWCAKCKLSFRMTSDLVLHMRSRHKETGFETQGKRRRELQLSCPVCYAYFRERHHLSRHMTSHC